LNGLERTARTLGRHDRRGKRPALPRLWFVTDPDRVRDPTAVAARLPRGSGIIYRAFGAKRAVEIGRALSRIARRRGLVLLVGADEKLAATIGAAGVHLPERLAARAPRLRARRSAWVVTIAAHGPAALRRGAGLGADAILLSTVFDSGSPSASKPIGPVRLAALARLVRTPVIALGGLNATTARRLTASRVYGLAAVEGWLSPRT
jgi:thiamine-phosphate pyrophosphorylase